MPPTIPKVNVLFSYFSGPSFCGWRLLWEGGSGGGDTAQYHQTRLWAARSSSTYGAALQTKGWWESSRYVTLMCCKSLILCKCLFTFYSLVFPLIFHRYPARGVRSTSRLWLQVLQAWPGGGHHENPVRWEEVIRSLRHYYISTFQHIHTAVLYESYDWC